MNVQNLASVVLTDEQLRACVAAVDTLETAVPGLISLTAVQKRSMTKVGERSADFCRQTLDVMRQNPQLIPASLSVADGLADLKSSDQLRQLLVRLTQCFQRLQDTELALRSDAMSLALRGYQLLKLNGRNAGLQPVQRALGNRFSKRRKPKDPMAPVTVNGPGPGTV